MAETTEKVLFELNGIWNNFRPDNSEKNIILIDWFSMTSKCDSLSSIIHLLGLDYPEIKFIELSGMHGFARRYYFNGISIHFDGSVRLGLDNYVWVEMSGQGCRAYEQYSKSPDWLSLFTLILTDDNYNLTRLDVAYDDFDGILNIDTLRRELDHDNFVSNFRKTLIEYDPRGSDCCIYYGSKKSDIMFRCYNKAAERGREDEIDHWVRFEIQLRDEYAKRFLQQFHSNLSLGRTFSETVSGAMRYVIPSDDTNKSRWFTRRWWSKFVDHVDGISLYTPKDTDYNLSKLSNYVINNCGNATQCYIDIFGEDKFLADLEARSCRKNVKYEDLKNKARLADEIFSCSNDLLEAYEKLEKAGYINVQI